MNLCAVNGKEFGAMDGLNTWGQLLETLEQGEGQDRPVVTAVRFNGVDQPSFREQDLLNQTLEAAGPIDVDTCLAQALITDAVESGLNSLGALLEAAQQTADAFRSHDIADANGRLVEVVDTLHALAQLTAMVLQSGGTEQESRVSEASAVMARLRQNLEWLVSAAENQDWISAADVLEYDIVELIPKWQAVLMATASAVA
jgi:hypothetical protein